MLKLDPDNALKVAFAKLYQTVKKDIGDIRQEKIDMCDIHAVGKNGRGNCRQNEIHL